MASALFLDVILGFYSFRSPTFYWNELCCNAAFSLLPTSRQGNTDEESTAVSPRRHFCCCAICGSRPLHPPSSLSVSSSHVGWMNQESGELFGVRVEALLTHPWCCASKSLSTVSTLLQGSKSHTKIQADSGSAFRLQLELTCSVVQHHYIQWNLSVPRRNSFKLIQLTHVSYK